MNRGEALDALDMALDALEHKLWAPPIVTRPIFERARDAAAALRAIEGPTRAHRASELAAEGLGVREIARRLGVNPGSVHRALRGGVAKGNGDQKADGGDT